MKKIEAELINFDWFVHIESKHEIEPQKWTDFLILMEIQFPF